ncbi:MAG: amylo-alpha-1,6-glucosidase [Spirochaetales bacterium]|nr:amylo-alpha-1,6-glucosidase [Spirochaetales bacterium]
MKLDIDIQTFGLRYQKPKVLDSAPGEGSITIEDKDEIAFTMVKSRESESPEILLDFGRKTTGFLQLDMIRSLNADILIEYGPTLDSIFFSSRVTLGHGSGPQKHMHEDFLALRYMKIRLESKGTLPSDSVLQLKGLSLKFSAYPVDGKKRFTSSDERQNEIWRIGAYTTQLCLQKHEDSFCYREWLPEDRIRFLKEWKNPYTPYVIFDGPRRDREVWMGDVRTEALTSFYSLGLKDVIKSSLQVFADLQLKDGNIPASATSRQNFPEYSFWWIITLAEYLRFSDDMDYLESITFVYRDLMGWIMERSNGGKFADVDLTWMWTLGLSGRVGEAQCVLYRCFREAAWIEEYAGNDDTAGLYSDIARRLKEDINNTFWDEEKGVYLDRFLDSRFDDLVFLDFNVYAVTLGVADESKTARLLDYIKSNMWTDHGTITYAGHFNRTDDKWGHDQTVWPFIVGYELEALFLAGRDADAFELIQRCWGTMLDQEATAFWEFKGENGEFPTRSMIENPQGDNMCSYSHGWSGWVSYLQQRYIAGITALAPGFKMILLDPHLHTMEWCQGSVETAYGPFTVSYDTSDEGFLDISLSKSLQTGVYIRTDRDFLDGRTLRVNGNVFDFSNEPVTTMACQDLPENEISLVRLPE